MADPDFEDAKRYADEQDELHAGHEGCFGLPNLSRAYLSLLSAVEPLLEVVDAACIYMDSRADPLRASLVERASALRDLLGPTGGQA